MRFTFKLEAHATTRFLEDTPNRVLNAKKKVATHDVVGFSTANTAGVDPNKPNGLKYRETKYAELGKSILMFRYR